MPPTALDELRNLPQEILNVNKELDKVGVDTSLVIALLSDLLPLPRADRTQRLTTCVCEDDIVEIYWGGGLSRIHDTPHQGRPESEIE